MHAKDKGLWVKIFEDKCLKRQSIVDVDLKTRQDCSSTWRGVLYGSELLAKGLIWRIGKGNVVKF